MKKFITKTLSIMLSLIMILGVASFATLAVNDVRVTKLSNTGNGIRIDYSKNDKADFYTFYRKDASTDWKLIATVKSSNLSYYVDKTAEGGVYYTYSVGYISENVESDTIDDEGSLYCLNTPDFTLSMANNKVLIKYDVVAGASGYQILRKTDSTGFTTIGYSCDGTYIDSNVAVNTNYTYAVRACRDGSLSYIKYRTIYTYPAPSLSNTDTGVKVSYTKYTDAIRYELYRQNTDGSWTKIQSTKPVSWFYFVDKTAISGEYYNYSVRVVTNDGVIGDDSVGSQILFLSSPRANCTLVDNGVNITFAEAKGSDTYQILRKSISQPNYKTIGYTTTTEFTDITTVAGETYTYAVRARSNDGYYGYIIPVTFSYDV